MQLLCGITCDDSYKYLYHGVWNVCHDDLEGGNSWMPSVDGLVMIGLVADHCLSSEGLSQNDLTRVL